MTTTTFADCTSRTAALRAAEQAAPPQRHWLRRLGTALWKAFEASGQARARVEMLSLAERFEHSQPELAWRLRFAAEHRSVD